MVLRLISWVVFYLRILLQFFSFLFLFATYRFNCVDNLIWPSSPLTSFSSGYVTRNSSIKILYHVYIYIHFDKNSILDMFIADFSMRMGRKILKYHTNIKGFNNVHFFNEHFFMCNFFCCHFQFIKWFIGLF